MRFRLLFTLGLGTTVMVWFLITPSYKMLGQKTVLRSPSLEVFLVTRHERLFLHYIGDAYSFGCRSDETKNFPEQKNLFLGPGVTPIPGPILRCDVTDEIRCDVEVLAPRARDSFFISSDGVLGVRLHDRMAVSFDGCKSFQFSPDVGDKGARFLTAGKPSHFSFSLEEKEGASRVFVTEDGGKTWNLREKESGR